MAKILLIEDEKILADMYRENFIKAGLDVVSAGNAEDGLKLAKKEKPDLIILDIVLPKKNGIDFLKDLRGLKKISSTSVVVLSNYDNPRARKESGRLGAIDYLVKTDFTPVSLTEKIKEYLP